MDIYKELLFVFEVLLYTIPIILAIIGYFKLIQYYKKRGVKNIVKIDKTIQFSFCILCWFLFLNPSTIKHKEEGAKEFISKFNEYGNEKIGLGRVDKITLATIFPNYTPIDFLDSLYINSYLGTYIPNDLDSIMGNKYYIVKEEVENKMKKYRNDKYPFSYLEKFPKREYWEKKIERKNFYIFSFTKLNVDNNHRYIIGFGIFEMIFIFDKNNFKKIN